MTLLIALVALVSFVKRVDPLAAFIEGAQEAGKLALAILPPMVLMIVTVSLLQASDIWRYFTFSWWLPNLFWLQALLRPLTSAGSLALVVDIYKQFGVDSFVAQVATVLQGSADTTVYIVALYYAAVRIQAVGRTLLICLLCDAISLVVTCIACAIYFQ